MKKPSLVRTKTIIQTVCLCLALSTSTWGQNNFIGGGSASAAATFGEVIPLPGEINELFVDEARRLIYACNFTGGRVEVISMDTHQSISRITTTPTPAGSSGMTVTKDGRYLIVTNVPVTSSVTQSSGVTVVNLNDPSDRRFFTSLEEPLGVAAGSDGRALVLTKNSLQLFDPIDGSFQALFDLTDAGASAPSVTLPLGPMTELDEIVKVNLSTSRDGRWIFGVADAQGGGGFVFSYRVAKPVGLLTIRPGSSFVNSPVFNQVSGSQDGAYFMVGNLLMSTDLRVIADTPEGAGAVSAAGFFGGHGIDSNIDTVYGSFGELTNNSDSVVRTGVLQIMDDDNLHVRQRIRLPNRVTGRILSTDNGQSLYAIAESGIMHLPMSKLSELPILESNVEDRALLFPFDFCNRVPVTKTLRLESPNGQPANFSLSTEHFRSSNRPAVVFEPHQGTTPADIQVTIDPGSLGPVQGTNTIVVQIDTNAVNVPLETTVVSNVRDVDQKGSFVQSDGHLIGAVADPSRDRFYVLDRNGFQVKAYDSKSLRQIGSFRTGNTPTWMAASKDGRFLVVANSGAEHVTLIDLNSLRVMGNVFVPWQLLQGGHYPHSVTAANSEMVLGVNTAGGGWRLDFLTLPNRAISSPETLGVFANSFGSPLAVAAHPDGNEVFVADSSGGTYLFEFATRRLIITRSDFSGVGGAIGAARDYYTVDNFVLNRSLVPLGEFPDSVANQQSSGFALLPNGTGVRSIRPTSQVDTGTLQKLNSNNPAQIQFPTRMAEPPPARAQDYRFTSTLAALRDGGLISTTSAGILFFPSDYADGGNLPVVDAVTNAADFTRTTGTGGLISIFGSNFSKQDGGAVDSPLPQRIGDTCVSANGSPLPLLFVSNNQINAQLLFSSVGPTDVQVHSSAGLSDVFVQQVDATAPAIFTVPGPEGNRFAAVFRAENNKPATLSNPLRPNEIAIIYATGLGPVAPISLAGTSASMTILSRAAVEPTIDIGGVKGIVEFAGLTPGFIGLYQINVRLPGFVPTGLEVPLKITQGGNETVVSVRIIE